MSKISNEEIVQFFKHAFPDNPHDLPSFSILETGYAQLRLEIQKKHIRPGGYISGPTQMALADHAAYVAIFTQIGITPMAVTSNLNIDFLRPCIGTALITDARILKCGRTLAVINVDLFPAGQEKTSSRATVTYALPTTPA